jgi:hypothetical protein
MAAILNTSPDQPAPNIARPTLSAPSMVFLAHEVPGRIRFRIPSLKRDCDSGRRLAEHVGAVSGVTAAQVNMLTGSLIVQFDGTARTREEVFAALAEHGYRISEQPSPQSPTKASPPWGSLLADALASAFVDILLRDALYGAIAGASEPFARLAPARQPPMALDSVYTASADVAARLCPTGARLTITAAYCLTMVLFGV